MSKFPTTETLEVLLLSKILLLLFAVLPDVSELSAFVTFGFPILVPFEFLPSYLHWLSASSNCVIPVFSRLRNVFTWIS
ncbi:hypothetical protein AGABI1DRAFT_135272 [Agaricus bisporus var. burnettii JB137-S8]|uniref:Uncharacterized protein n=1 Tax=Agaricus bisporus var. burnettii (strain JB137-S8 / ATCC MYA-4627 / FGSC 10392) TaxID=597362 RepID=K5WRS9_AGABU|nr:uncharacterized protein AGABI1DRAFT_135272 [Agaricus bisporus var. burnettii JB137-S8]EKM73237.1 hypothetical protein AGABI1DRAFT_135272 [Agaricus bisporus var. burnettii JB137-S8]